MRTITNFLLAIAILICFSCEKDQFTNATVIRDCGNTYLRIEDKDYLVCNLEMVENYNDGAKIKVSINKLNECSSAQVNIEVCVILHPNEGWIKVNSIE
jgi:hypothetical protein